MKTCIVCRQPKPLDDFHHTKRDGCRPRCKPCHNALQRDKWHADPERHRYYGARWKRENPGKKWQSELWRRYRLTPDQYDNLAAEQGGGCFVCGAPDERGWRKLSVHHDHACCPGNKSCGNCVLALLCGDCNRAEGLLGSDPERIRRLLTLVAGQVGLSVGQGGR